MVTRSRKALIEMIFILFAGIAFGIALTQWKPDLFQQIYLADEKTYILNGLILLIFFLGIVQLAKGFQYYAFEEKQACFLASRI